eukprot:GHVT01047609.1.p1 GENE.GHVT01047609.1~~GHVT01047609.1.p1  ORF type:complete len:387 (-),score=37.01 GHVT01047609.1:672-1832(-)
MAGVNNYVSTYLSGSNVQLIERLSADAQEPTVTEITIVPTDPPQGPPTGVLNQPALSSNTTSVEVPGTQRLRGGSTPFEVLNDSFEALPLIGVLSPNMSTWNGSLGVGTFVYPPNDAGDAVDELRERYPNCPAACEDGWTNDKWCDSECNLKECGFDEGDCEGWCGGECRPKFPGDGQCDVECYKEECQWDGGDCPEWREKDYKKMDFDKHNSTWDYSECQCDLKMIGDHRCDPECNTYECRLDGLDCLHECDSECPLIWLGDGSCDWECDKPRCFHDKGDCGECAPGCRDWKKGNGICDPECNVAKCAMDDGDCEGVRFVLQVDYSVKPFIYQFCAVEFIGDGHCDETCYNTEGEWDRGDCQDTDVEREAIERGVGPPGTAPAVA